MSDAGRSFVGLKKADPSPTLLSRRNLRQLSLDIVSPTAQQQTTNLLETNVSSLTDDASLRYSLDTTDINLLDQHEMELKSKDTTTEKENNKSHNDRTTTASPRQQKSTKRTSPSSSSLSSSTVSTYTNTSQKNEDPPYKVGSRVWVLWKEQELKAWNGRPVIKWDGVKTRTTMDISDIKRFVVKDDDEDETVSQSALTEVLVINDDEAPPELVDKEDDTFEEKSKQGDNPNKTTIKDQVLTAQTEDDESMKKAFDDTIPPNEKVDEDTINNNTKQSDEEDDIPDDNAPPSALVMIEDLEQHLDDYLKSVDKAQEVVVAWNKRKVEIKKELENGRGVIDATLVEPE